MVFLSFLFINQENDDVDEDAAAVAALYNAHEHEGTTESR